LKKFPYLVFFETVLEDVLYDETTSFTKSNLMPHSSKSFVDVLHDLWRRVTPAKLKQLLPDVASVAMDDCLRDASKKFVDHDSFVIFWDDVKGLLDNMTAEGIHAQSKSVTADRIGNGDDLIRCTVFEASLNEEVAKAVDHKRVCLSNDSINNVTLLLGRGDFELLLQEDGSLLIVALHNLVDDKLPIAVHVTVKEATVVERLDGRHIARSSFGGL